MPFAIKSLLLPSILLSSVVLTACSGQNQGRYSSVGQTDPFICVTASNFSKCRIEREKLGIAPTVRPGRR